MANSALLSRVPLPAANIHPIPTQGLAPEEAARRYEQELKSFYEATRGETMRRLFNVTLLGLGEDGHLASLFSRNRCATGTGAMGRRCRGRQGGDAHHTDLSCARKQLKYLVPRRGRGKE